MRDLPPNKRMKLTRSATASGAALAAYAQCSADGEGVTGEE